MLIKEILSYIYLSDKGFILKTTKNNQIPNPGFDGRVWELRALKESDL